MKIFELSWTFHVATGFPSESSQDLHLAMDFDCVYYPLQEQANCPDLSAEPCFSSNFVIKV